MCVYNDCKNKMVTNIILFGKGNCKKLFGYLTEPADAFTCFPTWFSHINVLHCNDNKCTIELFRDEVIFMKSRSMSA